MVVKKITALSVTNRERGMGCQLFLLSYQADWPDDWDDGSELELTKALESTPEGAAILDDITGQRATSALLVKLIKYLIPVLFGTRLVGWIC